ncbi:MAG TPA: hypothetical protein VLT36_00820, partial [Candidatus Dormibacteraeota bacterium]|nr:hypothetical protein [Candidatus Dormibacteraeota bacterium]
FVDGLQNDTVNMWLNPDPSTFGAAVPPTPTVGPIGGTSGTDMTQLSHFFFRSTQTAVRKIADEVRIGYTWAEVTPLAPPTLNVAQSGPNAVLTWPSFYSTDFVLQSRSNLISGTWGSVTNVPAISGSNWTVTVPLSGSARFFRLIK